MYTVAITRWARPAGEELAALAPLFGLTAYDLRLRLLGPIPVVAAQGLESGPAAELTAALRSRGHGALACDTTSVVGQQGPACAREFAFEPDEMVISIPGSESIRLATADIRALVLATRFGSESSTTTTTRRKLSLGRAAMTGGLLATRKKKTESHEQSEDRELVLYLFARDREPILLCEQGLRYAGLGPDLAATRGQNFRILVQRLRQIAPQAIFDERLAVQPRKPGLVGATYGPGQRGVVLSNEADLALAARLLVQAYQENQI